MFVTLCTKDYLVGFEVLLKSLVENNPRVIKENIPFLIISNEITEEDLIVSKKIYKNIKIKNFDEAKYEKLNEIKKEAMASGDYYKYEIFSITGCDKIIFLDSDTLVLGNIDCLIDFKQNFGAARDLYIDQFNTGVMVIGKKYLKKDITVDLINLTSFIGVTEHLDQDIINNYFIDDIVEFSLSYNFLKIYHKLLFRNSPLAKHIKILHYVVKKPWQQKKLVPLEEESFWLDRYWLEYYSKTMKLRLSEDDLVKTSE